MAASAALLAYEHRLYEQLEKSELFGTYCNAFRKATGLPLRLVAVDEQWCLPEHLENQSPFCEALNLCKTACEGCISANRRLVEEAVEVKGPANCTCFAGLSATAVPVKLGSSIFAFLKTGQVFQRPPTPEDFERVATTLKRQGVKPADLRKLKEAYLQTTTIDPERYQSMVTLLASFAEQLSTYADRLSIIDEGREPEAIAKARQFIHAHLDEALPLPLVARQAGLSESHFCRVFKDVTGLTLTDYVTRCRIGWAKRELLRPAARISEIAFKVGFQSLSQFNRSFARIVGCSPSVFRAGADASIAS
ncbi:MAG: helix-turn-helix domain-containing protein [Akkermansiaceae bacterium]|nr:helix-turn-helix domain-containing protein [Akkermansiaceae bacterium]NNM28939.1 helix-turn-helix domain-containing protein [Akkermansiaceae bacterium]